MDLTTPNGYQQASSPSAVHSTSSSPGMITKAMTKQSPPGGGGGQHQPQQQQQQQRPNLRVVIPNSRGEAPVSEEVSSRWDSFNENSIFFSDFGLLVVIVVFCFNIHLGFISCDILARIICFIVDRDL